MLRQRNATLLVHLHELFGSVTTASFPGARVACDDHLEEPRPVGRNLVPSAHTPSYKASFPEETVSLELLEVNRRLFGGHDVLGQVEQLLEELDAGGQALRVPVLQVFEPPGQGLDTRILQVLALIGARQS